MRWIVIAASMLIATPASSADCGAGNADLLAIEGWSATPGDFGSVNVTIDLKNTADKQIRMVKATAVFFDPFGERIANLAIDPDIVIPPNASHQEKGNWQAARLAKVRPTDVEAKLCVSAVLYEDGTKQVFQ
jgi:hypothetical protein